MVLRASATTAYIPEKEVTVKMTLSIMKIITCGWIVVVIDYIKSKPDMISNSFSHPGILDAIHSSDNNSGDPFEDI